MSQSNLLTEWAWLLLDSFAAAGVSDVVISPGSRSTPFVVAASRHPQLRCHDLFDERTAAFFALGQARVSARPSLLVCTSGTAGAHYLPAIIEAGMSHTPLLVLTADRPAELMDCGAPQTIDQLKLFGDHVRAFVELGAPDPQPGALRALRRKAAQAVLECQWPVPGAVHLNAKARKPLEPTVGLDGDVEGVADRVHRLVSTPIVAAPRPSCRPDAGAIAAATDLCAGVERGLIVCGPAPVHQAGTRRQVGELALRTGFPILAEAASQLRFVSPAELEGAVRVDRFGLLLGVSGAHPSLAPDVVIQIGAPPVSGSWQPFLDAHGGCRRIVMAPWGWPDPSSSASLMLFGDLPCTLEALLGALGTAPAGDGRWARQLGSLATLVDETVERELERLGQGLSEGAVARAVVECLPDQGLLSLGNSLPIRLVEDYARSRPPDLRVLSQRGVNGIDGLISGTAGAISGTAGAVMVASSDATPAAAPCPAAVLLIGDVSFAHDLGGLAALRLVQDVPIAIVVLNNEGGRIFEQLPIFSPGGAGQETPEHWLTPPSVSLPQAAAAFGLPYTRAESVGDLEAALGEALSVVGATIVEAVVPAHGAVEQGRRLTEVLEKALSGAVEAW